MIRRVAVILAIGLLGTVFVMISFDYSERHALRPLAEGYVMRRPSNAPRPM